MHRILLLGVALLPCAAGAAETTGEYLVITPKPWAAALEPLLAVRRGQGYRVLVVTTDTLTDRFGEVSDVRIRQLLAKRRPAVCVLVGDVPRNMPKALRKLAVPTRHVLPGVYGGDEAITIASDTAYGIFRPATAPAADEPSHVPTVQVGRLSARSPETLKTIVSKLVAAAGPLSMGPWRRRVHMIGGSPNYGLLIDAMIERMAGRVLGTAIAPRFEATMTYANANSIYCWPPPRFARKVVDRFGEGCLVFGYVGHGLPTSVAGLFDPLRRRTFDVLDTRIARELTAPAATATVCVLITCSTGRFDGTADCLAEVLAAQPRGPVAVIASSRISMPYGNAVFGKQLLEAICREQKPTVGDALVHAFRTMLAKPDVKDTVRLELDAAAAMMKRGLASPAERIKHVYLYNLFGDPAMRIPYPPIRATVEVAGAVKPGGTLRVTVTTGERMDGEATITVEIPRTAVPFPRVVRQRAAGTLDDSFKANYANAHNKILARASDRLTNGRVTATVALPASSRMYAVTDIFHVRVHVTGTSRSAFGATTVARAGIGALPR